MNIHLDITTHSTVYNAISAKAQWIHHRFGERKYSAELPIDIINNIAKSCHITHITLMSYFGDPCDHSNFGDVVSTIAKYNKPCTIITYGMNESAMKLISSLGFAVYVKVCDKVFLGQDINAVVEHCKLIDTVMIEETVFKHNQYSNVKNICLQHNWQYFYSAGYNLSGFCTSVIDRTGSWLYDVHAVDTDASTTLVKTTAAWHRLKMFVKPVVLRSITDKPAVQLVKQTTEDLVGENTELFVTPSGHIIQHREKAAVFTNALCNDWDPAKLNKNEYYENLVLTILSDLLKVKLDTISLYHNELDSIIEFYL